MGWGILFGQQYNLPVVWDFYSWPCSTENSLTWRWKKEASLCSSKLCIWIHNVMCHSVAESNAAQCFVPIAHFSYKVYVNPIDKSLLYWCFKQIIFSNFQYFFNTGCRFKKKTWQFYCEAHCWGTSCSRGTTLPIPPFVTWTLHVSVPTNLCRHGPLLSPSGILP